MSTLYLDDVATSSSTLGELLCEDLTLSKPFPFTFNSLLLRLKGRMISLQFLFVFKRTSVIHALNE